MKPTVELVLITSDVCNVRCKSCPAGRHESGLGGVMSLDMATQILAKATSEAHVTNCALYYYNEPFMLKETAPIVRMVRDFGVPTRLSTNLNTFKHGPDIMQARPDTLMLSVSGFTKPVYERSHATGDIERVKENMVRVAELRHPNTYVQVSWHKYTYNQAEQMLMASFAMHLGFAFMPYATYLMPPEKTMRAWVENLNPPEAADLIIPLDEMRRLCTKRKWFPCPIQDSCIAVNSEGVYANCGSSNDKATLRQSFFDLSVADILRLRRTDPECIACKSIAGHVLASQSWTRSPLSPALLGGVAARKLGLFGLAKRFLSRNYGRNLLPKP